MRRGKTIFLHLCALVAALHTAENNRKNNILALSDEKRLIKDLIETYKQAGVVGRPVKNSSEILTFRYGLALVQILGLDEKNQVLTISAWNRFEWNDYLLSWNASDYAGVEVVRVPAEDIWKPDLVLYNYADDRLEEFRKQLAVVSSDGTVMWIPPAIFKSSCSIDITNFPFDSQICFLKFGSWTYDGSALDIDFYEDKPEISLKNFVPSNEWDVLAHPGRKNVIYYPCCTAPYPDLTYTLVLKRQVAFYSYILILPCVLLSLLTMVLFWLPPESPAKMQLGMNIFVAFFLLLLLLTENTPPAASTIPLMGLNIFVAFFVLLLLLAEITPPSDSTIPVIGAYYCLNMIMITISTFLAVFIIHMYFRGPRTNKLPPWIKRIVLDGLATLVCMRNYIPKERKAVYEPVRSIDPKIQKKLRRMKIQELKYNKYAIHDVKEAAEARDSTCPDPRDTNHRYYANGMSNRIADTTPDMSPIHFHQSLESDVREIRRFMKTYIYKEKSAEAMEHIRGEWRAVALVIDRMFFFLYVMSIIVSLIFMFPRGS